MSKLARVDIGAALDDQRDAAFVGRRAECELLWAVHKGRVPYRVVQLSGPGGIGKSELLHYHLRRCREAGVRGLSLAGRRIHPTPSGFVDALCEAAGLAPGDDWTAALGERASVLAVDNLELLAPLESWFYGELLPRVPASCHVVVASRSRPSAGLLAAAGMGDLLKVLPLRNFDPDECRGYLAHRGVSNDQAEPLHSLTHGHPLALALFAEVARHRKVELPRLESYPQVVEALLNQLTQSVPSEAHRTALRVSSLSRTTTEDLLHAILGEEAPALFDWLRGLDFVQTTARGLEPHDLVRDALRADLRWRNERERRELTRKCLAYHLSQLSLPDRASRREHLADAVFVAAQGDQLRDRAFVQPDFSRYRAREAKPEDWPAIEAMVRHHHGPASSLALRVWRAADCAQTRVLHGADGALEGFVTFVALERVSPADAARDVGVETAVRFLESKGVEPGQPAFLSRFWLARETGQALSPVQTSLFLEMFDHIVATPGLTYTLMPLIDPRQWIAHFADSPNEYYPEAGFELDGRRTYVVGHDFRRRSPAEWVLAHGFQGPALLTGSPLPSPAPPSASAAPPPALEGLDLKSEVRRALRALDRPALLADSALLALGAVTRRAGPDATPHRRAQALAQLLREECERFQESPRDQDHYKVLCRSFFERPDKQVEMAFDVGLSYTTFRRRLTEAVERIADALRRAETDLGAREPSAP